MKSLKFFHFNISWMDTIPIISILLCALILRLIFFTGMVRGDDINYAHAAYELANGRTHFDYWQNGTFRIGLYGPVAILYAVFGPSELTTLIFPFLSSLLTVLVIYGIGKRFDGRKVGLIAALLWACLPLDVFLASDLLADAPVATFSAAAVYFFLKGDQGSTNKKATWYASSIVCLIWAVTIKPIAIVTFFFLLLFASLKLWPRLFSFLRRKRISTWIHNHSLMTAAVAIAVPLIILTGYALIQPRPLIVNLSRASTDFSEVMITGKTDIDLSDQRIEQISVFSVLGPLFLVSAVVLLLDRYAPARPALIWAGFYFFYYEWGTIGLNPLAFRPIINTEERSLLFTLVPLVIMAAIYLAKEMPGRDAAICTIVASGVVSLVAVAYGQTLLRIADLPGFVLLELLAIGFILASPYLAANLKAPGKQVAGVALVTVIGLALLMPSPPYHAGFWQFRRESMQNFGQVADFLVEQDGLVYVPSHSLAIRLNYASDFELGFDWAEEGRQDTEWRIRVGALGTAKEGEFYVVEDQVQSLPSSWREIYRIGQSEGSLYLYQAGTD